MISSKHKKLISIIICFLVVMSLISLNEFKVKANELSTNPTFKISNLSANPTRARVGEDILITGQLDPQDFAKNIQPKEIVLILDTSKSMKDEITINGVKTTKIDQLKKSAIEFVKKMDGVNNLKISIITYGSAATINKVNIAGNNTSLIPVNSSNINNLTTIINNISANGGTNIGEGLRQATYLLNNSTESNKEADKTIILMSDALPTYCTLASKDPISYYLDTTKELGGITWNSGSGSNDVFGYDLNYAKEVGKLINASKLKVFTVGYGLEAEGLNKFKQIHASMLGLTSDQCNEENGFYSKSDGSIDEIFKKVGDKIIENYFLKESELDLNLTKDFTLKIGGKNIKIRDIQYKKVSTDEDIKKTGKILYHADPVDFSFIVRGSKVGDNQLVLDRIDINFLFENSSLSESHNVDLRVDITDEELPHISVKLLSDFNLEINSDDEITLKYEIIPEDFEFIDYTNPKAYEFNTTINLNIGNNFEPVEGIVRSKEEGKSNMGIVEVPTITYKLIGNNTYKAERQMLELKLRANNLTSGTYMFGNEGDNYISYKSLRNNLMKFSVDTPLVYVKSQIDNLTHGLYNGINNGSMEIQENDGQPFVIAPSSTLTFGSSFILKGSKADLILNIDNNLIVRDDEIKVYKLVEGKLEEVKSTKVSNEGNNRYNISITGSSGNTPGENLLIVYRGTVKEEEKQGMKNTITISNISKVVNMFTTSSSNDSPRLPDLF